MSSSLKNISSISNNPSDSSLPINNFAVGDRVKASNNMVGQCRFIGTIHNKLGLWVGIDLGQNLDPLAPDRWYAKGKNSGSVNGVSYFHCDPDCGIFFPISKVQAYPYPQSSTTPPSPLPQSNSFLLPQPSPPPNTNSNPPPRQRRLSKPSLAQPGPTPRPKSRPSLPAQSRKPTLVGSASSNNIARKFSTNLSLDRPSPSYNLVSPPPLPSPSVHPLSSSLATNSKRSSASQLPASRAPSRASHKRAESVQSHYQAPSSDWPRFHHPHRPKSRLSQISSDSRPVKDDPALPTGNHATQLEILAMQVPIEELEKLALERGQLDAELQRARDQITHLEHDLAELKAQAELASQLAHQSTQSRLADAERERSEYLSRLAQLDREREETATAHAARLAAAEREQAELHEQLAQLRTAGQSLCCVYEDKMAGMAEVREIELEEASRLREELRGARDQLAATEARLASAEPGRAPSRSHEAIEIDNERLRADLKYAKDRLAEVQDAAYELRQELAAERESRELLGQQHSDARLEHKLVVKQLRDEMATQTKERNALQLRLGQVEARLKETLETMEQERAELEGLRDEILVSGHSVGRARPERSVLAASQDEPDASRLRVELGRRDSGSGPSNGPSGLMEHEKHQIVQKYQRLLMIKDEENLSLVNRIAELEDELATPRNNARSMVVTDSSSATQQLARGSEDANGVGAQTIDSVGRSVTLAGAGAGAGVDKKYVQSEEENLVKKANEQIVGLKLIVNQAHVDRIQVEERNSELNGLVEELKEANEELEREVERLKSVNKLSPSGSGSGSGSGAGAGVGIAGPSTPERMVMWNGSMSTMMTPSTMMTRTTATTRTTTTTGFEEQEEALNEVRMTVGSEASASEVRKVRRLEREIDGLRVKVLEMERSHARQVRGLHQEVAELESMIESKVFKEEELEMEIERLKRFKSLVNKSDHQRQQQKQQQQEEEDEEEEERLLEKISEQFMGVGGESGSEDEEKQKQQDVEVEVEEQEDECLEIEGCGSEIEVGLKKKRSTRKKIKQDKDGDGDGDGDENEDKCELCEEIGHGLELCPVFMGSGDGRRV